MDKARRAAAVALVRMHGGQYTAEALDAALKQQALSQRERAFAASLFLHTAEHLVTLDVLLLPFLRRPMAKLDVEVRAILETGLCQIRYMQVPTRAAIHEAVNLTRGLGKSSAAGFVNAVLRKAATASLPNTAEMTEEERICTEHSVSPAVAKALVEALAQDCDAYLKASHSDGTFCLRVNTLRTTQVELEKNLLLAGAEVSNGLLPHSLRVRLAGGVVNDPLFEKGMYHVQDFASQFAAMVLQAQPGQRILDLCAAPGGKSATLAQCMQGGHGLTVCDVNSARLQRAKDLFARLGIENAIFMENDAAEYRKELAGQDAVLCDVPCSGLGVLASKPDLRYGDGAHFAQLPPLQLRILQTASRYVRVGGRLIYATCTPRPAENAEVVRAFLAEHSGYVLVLPENIPKNVCIDEKMMTFLPQNTNTAGFFVASMERIC